MKMSKSYNAGYCFGVFMYLMREDGTDIRTLAYLPQTEEMTAVITGHKLNITPKTGSITKHAGPSCVIGGAYDDSLKEDYNIIAVYVPEDVYDIGDGWELLGTANLPARDDFKFRVWRNYDD